MKKKIIIGSLIGIILIAFVTISIMKNSGTSPVFSGGSGISVKTAVVETGDISSSVSASGVVEEVEKAEVYFDAPVKVKGILIDKNQKVSRGQQVLDLDLDELNSQLEQFRINRSIQELGKGTSVSKSEVVRAESSLKSTERAYNDSVKTLNKNKQLYESNAISKNELEMSEKAVVDTGEALEAARFNYKTAVQNSGVDTETREQNLKVTDLQIAELEKKIGKIRESMLSPIDGVISEMNVVKGGMTASMQPSYKVVNLDRLRVKAKVNEYNIKTMKVGQDVVITGDAIEKDSKVAGKITSISPVADKSMTSSGEETSIEVLIEIVQSAPSLKPGLSVTCDITTNEKKGVLLVGLETLKEDKDGNKSVFVVDEKNGIMHETKIVLGVTSDMKAEVREGLKAGDAVVQEPQPSYKDGAKVRLPKSEKK
jgi:HlyD family secretion protein